MSTIVERENKRQQYKPEIIRLLFIGESPPAGGTFFYDGNSNLAAYTKKAFERLLGVRFASTSDFLAFFKDKGCYLDDLSLEPINHLNGRERKSLRIQNIVSFADRITGIHPKPLALVIVMKGIREAVEKSIQKTGLIFTRKDFLAFPDQGHQNEYVNELAKILSQLQEAHIIV